MFRNWMCLLLLCVLPLQGGYAWAVVHCAHAAHAAHEVAVASAQPDPVARVVSQATAVADTAVHAPQADGSGDAPAAAGSTLPCDHCAAASVFAMGNSAPAGMVLPVSGSPALPPAQGHADDPITRLEHVPLALPTSPP